jgi:hypothetical protein
VKPKLRIRNPESERRDYSDLMGAQVDQHPEVFQNEAYCTKSVHGLVWTFSKNTKNPVDEENPIESNP